ncbi:MAG TPA: hypothetical protein VG406_16300 [Isosphaeraceae bacterium]|jgi:hypothetical protein|nr:hypothetical protein [Isosphaeraceae bacterium]
MSAFRPQAQALEGRTLLAAAPLRAHPSFPILPATVVVATPAPQGVAMTEPSSQPPGPTVTAASVTRAGIVLTFSEPMDPATVANARNYTVQDITLRPLGAGDLVTGVLYDLGIRSAAHNVGAVRLRAATYDPTTLSVKLVPTRPLMKGDVYTVSGRTTVDTSPHGSAARPLTDLAGEPLVVNVSTGRTVTDNGTFTVTVAPPLGHNPVLVSPATVFGSSPGQALPPGVG